MDHESKRSKTISRLVQALQSYKPERIYLFGSWARGEEDELSDLDIVVIKETKTCFFSRLQEVSELLPEGAAADILVYTPEEFRDMTERGNAFADMILEEGELIYERVHLTNSTAKRWQKRPLSLRSESMKPLNPITEIRKKTK